MKTCVKLKKTIKSPQRPVDNHIVFRQSTKKLQELVYFQGQGMTFLLVLLGSLGIVHLCS